MINQFEMPACLHYDVPEMDEMLTPARTSPYEIMRALRDFTAQNIRSGNYGLVKKCLNAAAKLYDRGDNTIQNAVENVFVYSMESLLNSCEADRAKLLAAFPITLCTLYVNQVCQRGC